ncbi:MAG TPA: glycosyltransferase family 4 protein, partial [Nitrospira sp.]|nr:glycosyltransferase family 4 protein [Nitrospira sp.]
YFHPDISATSQLLTELTEDLASQGETVTVITGNTAYTGGQSALPDREMYKGIHIVRVGCTRFGRTSTLGRLADCLSFWVSAFVNAVRATQQDCLVVLSDPPLLSVLAAVVRMIKPVKTVCWLQDVFPEIAVRAGILPEGFVARCLRRLAQWSLRQMDQVVVIGRCMERHVLSEGVGLPSVTRIPNWADGSHIKSLPRENNAFLQQHHLENQFVIMYSGNHGVVHEYETLVALLRETRSVPELCFCFIGEGAWKKKLIETAQAERWPHVRFLPYQPKSLLQSSLSAADMHLVSLRTDMEGLSIPSKVYGALAAGRPVIFIGPRGSETAALVREAQCGYSVQPGDTQGAVQAVLAGYEDRALLEQQGQAARVYFTRRFDRNIATRSFHQVFQRVSMSPAVRPFDATVLSPPPGSGSR